MFHTRYSGEFLSQKGITWKVDILQESVNPYPTIGELTFDSDEAVTIEWINKSKEEVICNSTATLHVISPSDRTYIDLYAVKVGDVRCDIYRNNSLYWSGTIDTEFYEEPYERLNGYTVTLNFSDFGILGRLKYNLSGMKSLEDIVSNALSRSRISYNGINQLLISSSLDGNKKLKLADISVNSANFYDEEGEASTLEEVIEGILQPLALRIVQRNGSIAVYDLNGFSNKAITSPISWNGDSQTLGVDSVYNNANITFSPYPMKGNLSKDEVYNGETDNSTALNMVNGKIVGDATIYSYHATANVWNWMDETDKGFTLWTKPDGQNLTILNPAAQFFRIVPQYDGSEAEGVAVCWYGHTYIDYIESVEIIYGHDKQFHGVSPQFSLTGFAEPTSPLFASQQIDIPKVDNPSDLNMRIALEMMMDCRFNPYIGAEDLGNIGNEKEAEWYEEWKKHYNFMFIPVKVKFTPFGSTDTYYWTNIDQIGDVSEGEGRIRISETYGQWIKNVGQPIWGYFVYYNKDDMNDCAVLGWHKNRQGVGFNGRALNTMLKRCDDGQYIPYPTSAGTLTIEVYRDGWVRRASGYHSCFDTAIHEINWLLFKAPEVEIINAVQFGEEIEDEDIEYTAILNPEAKEDIDIDTICGTSADGVPTAKGAYYDSTTGEQVKQLTREGRTSQAEELLIGTLYSQFAERHTTLQGEAEINPYFGSFSEQNQGDKKFIALGESQNLIADTTDITICELSKDEYDKKN